MTDETIEGAAARGSGKFKEGLGRVLGDQKLQVEGALEDAKGRSLETYGKAMDAVDRLIDRAPVGVQDHARTVAAEARKRPLATTLIVGALGLLLARAATRR